MDVEKLLLHFVSVGAADASRKEAELVEGQDLVFQVLDGELQALDSDVALLAFL